MESNMRPQEEADQHNVGRLLLFHVYFQLTARSDRGGVLTTLWHVLAEIIREDHRRGGEAAGKGHFEPDSALSWNTSEMTQYNSA